MKAIKKWTWASITLFILLVSVPTKTIKAQSDNISFQIFYDELSPYGQWINDAQYGYVWSPDVGRDFRPYYTNGRWAMTEYGNTWVSNYEWGWATFHYGRWVFDEYYGWLWVPGYEWGPAWVNWRTGGGYYGWAPLSPGFSFSIVDYNAPFDWWIFIPCGNIYSYDYYSYWRGPRYNNNIFHHTHSLNNYYHNSYVYGPRRDDIEHYTGGKIRTYNIRTENKPRVSAIRDNELSIYRPRISKTENNIAPRNFVKSTHQIENKGLNTEKTNKDNIQNNGNTGRNDHSRPQDQNLQRQQQEQKMREEQINRDNARQQQEQQKVQQQNIQRQEEINRNNIRQQQEQQRVQQQNIQRQQEINRNNILQQQEQQRIQQQNIQRQQEQSRNVPQRQNTRPAPQQEIHQQRTEPRSNPSQNQNTQRVPQRTENNNSVEPRRGR